MKIIFHFGPPKTGTSALQKWLSSNRIWLQQEGIYYPDHSVDINGVSSGNLRKIFDGQRAELRFSEALFEKEKLKAEQRGCSTILFSSEFFFRNIKELAQHIPEALFVGYVRFGLEILQSSYNQAVKRHGKTTPFVPGRHVQSTLSTLSKIIDEVGEDRFILRPYSKKLFVGGNLIADFLDALQVSSDGIDTTVGRVNPSYCLESIEVKRWFNQLESDNLQAPLDLALQDYGNQEPFSLFNDETFERSKQTYLSQVKRFAAKHRVRSCEEFLSECEALQNKPYREQVLTEQGFATVLETLISDKKLSPYTLYTAYQLAVQKSATLHHPERIAVLASVVPTWVKLITDIKRRLFSKRQQGSV